MALHTIKKHTIKKCIDADIEYEMFENDHYSLTEADYDHIRDLILDGYVEGELVSSTDGRGWWKLIN